MKSLEPRAFWVNTEYTLLTLLIWDYCHFWLMQVITHRPGQKGCLFCPGVSLPQEVLWLNTFGDSEEAALLLVLPNLQDQVWDAVHIHGYRLLLAAHKYITEMYFQTKSQTCVGEKFRLWANPPHAWMIQTFPDGQAEEQKRWANKCRVVIIVAGNYDSRLRHEKPWAGPSLAYLCSLGKYLFMLKFSRRKQEMYIFLDV